VKESVGRRQRLPQAPANAESTPSHGFPPRLQVMVLQKHPNGLSARAWNQLAPDSLLSRQSNRPTRPPFRWSAANHGEHALPL